MDMANLLFTFGPAAALASSVVSRVMQRRRAAKVERAAAALAAHESAARAAALADLMARPALPIHWHLRSPVVRAPRVMSRAATVATRAGTINAERRSYAAERPTERIGTGIGNGFLELWEQAEQLADDDMLVQLALMKAPDGTPRYAESRIAKFIGGRVEDRIAQVREVRGVHAPPKPVATKEYPQRTAEQAQLRKQLGIGKS